MYLWYKLYWLATWYSLIHYVSLTQFLTVRYYMFSPHFFSTIKDWKSHLAISIFFFGMMASGDSSTTDVTSLQSMKVFMFHKIHYQYFSKVFQCFKIHLNQKLTEKKIWLLKKVEDQKLYVIKASFLFDYLITFYKRRNPLNRLIWKIYFE